MRCAIIIHGKEFEDFLAAAAGPGLKPQEQEGFLLTQKVGGLVIILKAAAGGEPGKGSVLTTPAVSWC
jgi:hypothetical protein